MNSGKGLKHSVMQTCLQDYRRE